MTLRKLGPYEIHEVLGSGGMGTVYRGVQEGTGKEVAVKVLSPSLMLDESFRDRFAAEIKSLEKLRHSRIVELYGFGEQDGTLFYAMELVGGSSLQEEIAAGRRFGWREVIQIGIDVCGALKHAHDHGVIHRDIKPANLLLDHHEQVRLTDFGIAKLFGSTSQTVDGGVLGTADYMSPEQAEGQTVTPRSDIYSLGAVLYTLLAGRPPFQGKSLPEVVHKVRFEPPLPVRRFAPEAPGEIEDLLEQLLAKDPQQRTPTALALSKRLQAIVDALTLDSAGDAGGGMNPERMESAEEQQSAAAEELAGRETAVVAPNVFEHEATGEASISIVETTQAAANVAARRPSVNHYTAVDEDYRRRLGTADEPGETSYEFWSKWLALLGLLVGGAALIWYAARPPSADELFASIQNVMESGADDERIANEGQLRQFLRRFPDEPRREQVANWLADVDLARFGRRLERISRSSMMPGNVRPIEHLLIKAIRTETTDQVKATRQLQSLVALYPDSGQLSKEDQQCLALARRRLLRLTEVSLDGQEQDRELIDERLRFAADIAKQDPVTAGRIRQGIIDLYQDELWAQEYVDEARRLRNE